MKLNFPVFAWITRGIENHVKKQESSIDREDKNRKIITEKLEESHIILSEIAQNLSLGSATINLQEQLTTIQFTDLYTDLRKKLNKVHAIADIHQIPIGDLVQQLSDEMDNYRHSFNIILVKKIRQECLDPKDYHYQHMLEYARKIKLSTSRIQNHLGAFGKA